MPGEKKQQALVGSRSGRRKVHRHPGIDRYQLVVGEGTAGDVERYTASDYGAAAELNAASVDHVDAGIEVPGHAVGNGQPAAISSRIDLVSSVRSPLRVVRMAQAGADRWRWHVRKRICGRRRPRGGSGRGAAAVVDGISADDLNRRGCYVRPARDREGGRTVRVYRQPAATQGCSCAVAGGKSLARRGIQDGHADLAALSRKVRRPGEN